MPHNPNHKYRRNPWEVSTAPSVSYRPAVKERGFTPSFKEVSPLPPGGIRLGIPDQLDPQTFEAKVNAYLGNPKGRAFDYAETLAEVNPDGTIGDQPDNVRHALAGTYTAQSVSDLLKYGAGMQHDPVNRAVADVAGFVTANLMGLGHEFKHLPQLIKEEWEDKGIRGIYDALRTTGEDAANNFVGSLLSILPGLAPGDAEEIIVQLSNNNLLPDGVSGGNSNLYVKGEDRMRVIGEDYNTQRP